MVNSYILISTSWSSFSCLHITVTQSLGLGLGLEDLSLEQLWVKDPECFCIELRYTSVQVAATSVVNS